LDEKTGIDQKRLKPNQKRCLARACAMKHNRKIFF